jgi:hypothetical protein
MNYAFLMKAGDSLHERTERFQGCRRFTFKLEQVTFDAALRVIFRNNPTLFLIGVKKFNKARSGFLRYSNLILQ